MADESEYGGSAGMFTPVDRQAEPSRRDTEKHMKIMQSDPADPASGPTDVPSA